MGKEIIINSDKEQTRIAIVENGELVELFIETEENERTLGDICLGRVRKIMPSIQAAFVDIGQKQDAFLHFSDLSDNLPEILTFVAQENPVVGQPDAPLRHFDEDEEEEAGDEAEPAAAEEAVAPPPAPEEPAKSRSRRRRRRGRRQHHRHGVVEGQAGAAADGEADEGEADEAAAEGLEAEAPDASMSVPGTLVSLTDELAEAVVPPLDAAPQPEATAPASPLHHAGVMIFDVPLPAPSPAEPPAHEATTQEAPTEPHAETPAPAEVAAEVEEAPEPPVAAELHPAPEAAIAAEPAPVAEPEPEGEAPGEVAVAPVPAADEEAQTAPVAETTDQEAQAAENLPAEGDLPAPAEAAEAAAPDVVVEAAPALPAAPEAEPTAEAAAGAKKPARSGQRRRPSGQGRKRGDGSKPGDAPKPGPTSAHTADPDDQDDTIPAPRPRPQPLEAYLKRDQRILVKITKEPIANKGSRVSTDISLAGRFLVLVPLADYVAVSKKISSHKERRRLKALAKSLVPDGFGVIVRTVADGKNAKALDTDLRLLVEKWRKIEKKLAGKPEPPLIVHEDVNMVSSVVRDLFSDDYDRILIDEPRLYRNIKNYVTAVAPHMAPVVQMHKGKRPIFETTGLAKDVATAFESRVDLPSGGYLFIERTEAMYVVDVNSGRSGRGMTQEDNSLRVNLEAARVIARQIRLRDIGGIIVIDFIDLRDERNRQKVFDEIKKEFKRDRAVTKVIPMSDFGVMQITRQRLRPSFTTMAPVVSANGRAAEAAALPAPQADSQEPRQGRRRGRDHGPRIAEPQPRVEDLIQHMEAWIVAAKAQTNRRTVKLRVHPFTAAYLNRRIPNYATRWFMKHLVRVRIEADEEMAPLGFRFLDPTSGEELPQTIPSAEAP